MADDSRDANRDRDQQRPGGGEAASKGINPVQHSEKGINPVQHSEGRQSDAPSGSDKSESDNRGNG